MFLANIFTLKNIVLELLAILMIVLGSLYMVRRKADTMEEDSFDLNKGLKGFVPTPDSDDAKKPKPISAYISQILIVIGLLITAVQSFTVFKSFIISLIAFIVMMAINMIGGLLIAAWILSLQQKRKGRK